MLIVYPHLVILDHPIIPIETFIHCLVAMILKRHYKILLRPLNNHGKLYDGILATFEESNTTTTKHMRACIYSVLFEGEAGEICELTHLSEMKGEDGLELRRFISSRLSKVVCAQDESVQWIVMWGDDILRAGKMIQSK